MFYQNVNIYAKWGRAIFLLVYIKVVVIYEVIVINQTNEYDTLFQTIQYNNNSLPH